MAFNLPFPTLTQILGNTATYDPKTETTPEFMNGKFDELLKNDTYLLQQLNKCFYKGSIGASMNWNTLTEPGSYLCEDSKGENSPLNEVDSLYQWGQVIVFQSNLALTQIYIPHNNDFVFRSAYIGDSGSFENWKPWERLVKESRIAEIESRLTDLETTIGG